ncbi:restriction endonuclease [Streptomyces sp. 147326]|uniref:restriction endonuclease n=1 Tax=Streptomyces sp. 147326 TaxID=3074379 RepID=UPI00385744C7
MDADGFEHTVAALCARDGCPQVEVVGGTGALGADVIATMADGVRVVIQCKPATSSASTATARPRRRRVRRGPAEGLRPGRGLPSPASAPPNELLDAVEALTQRAAPVPADASP